jgi:Ca2+/Na+ antiporter
VAFGNAASDLIGNIVSFKTSRSASLALGELLGAGLFLNVCIAFIKTKNSKLLVHRRRRNKYNGMFRGSTLKTIISNTHNNILYCWVIDGSRNNR